MNRHRILVAYDGSEESFRALERAVEVASSSEADIDVITVMPPVTDAPADALRYLRDNGIEANLHAPVGEPAVEIARVADEGAYDTVYVGSRDGAVARALAPSVSRDVAGRAAVSVLIAR